MDSTGSVVDHVILPASSNCSHTIPEILLSPCVTYTVIIIVTNPINGNVSSQQSDIVFSAGGE